MTGIGDGSARFAWSGDGSLHRGCRSRALPGAWLVPRADEAPNLVPAGPFRDFGPAARGSKTPHPRSHLERAIRADVVVPVWTGLHGPDARWRPKANPRPRVLPRVRLRSDQSRRGLSAGPTNSSPWWSRCYQHNRRGTSLRDRPARSAL